MSKLIQLPIWQTLKRHALEIQPFTATQFFAQEPNRIKDFTFQFDELYIDFSKNQLTNATKLLLLELVQAQQLQSRINDLFSAKTVNFTENRAALHMALRVPDENSNLVATPAILAKIIATRKGMYEFAEKIREGEIKGATDKKFTDIVSIGVGGSGLGPQMLYHALPAYRDKNFNVHFISGMDGEEINQLLKQLNPETTLFVIASKSFTSIDTLANAKTVKDWLIKKVKKFDLHMVGVSENETAVRDFGIQPDYTFHMDDFVGGRYSIWSAVSIATVIAIGPKNFSDFLQGAHLVDQHFKNTSFSNNIPVLLGLLDVWNINFLKHQTRAILPYSYLLKILPGYLQQLEMESCGKSVTRAQEKVDYETGPIVWGDVGFIGQHSFYQLLHQGTQIVPIDIIISAHTQNNLEHHRHLALANAIAQTQAFTEEGHQPITVMMFQHLTPKIIGMLIALYEHKVFTKSVIWDINPFDQMGVERGKVLAKQYIAELGQSKTPLDDEATRTILAKASKC